MIGCPAVSTLDRRSFLRVTAIVAAGPAIGCGGSDGAVPDRATFPQSVASGDPRPDAVVLWTRAVDPANAEGDLTVTLEVATDRQLGQVVARVEGLAAPAARDHVVKVKVTGLAPATTYYYRFRTGAAVSPTGRTRTAPGPEQDARVRFAFASCQDYDGRYYNVWQQLVERDEELDFVLFLGDYVYESGGRVAGRPRQVIFSDPDGAMPRGGGLAARALSNYRDLYRTLRSDPVLQQVHERYPMVAIWDDHEFSDDCWGAHATYTSGAVDELEVERRRNAEQAYFEYLPIDLSPPAAAGPLDPDAAPRFPDAQIYRELTFGTSLRLILTDYRSYRPDHLVPEDAYPGTLFLTAEGLAAEVAAGRAPAALTTRVAGEAFTAVDIDAPALAPVKAELLAVARAEAAAAGADPDRADAVVRGVLALAHVNGVLKTRGKPELMVAAAPDQPHGLAFIHLGKRAWFTPVGSRFVVVEDLFQVYAAMLYASSGGASERALGPAQEDWLTGLLATPRPRGWTVVASSVSMSALVLDLRGKPGIPPDLQNRIVFTADQWDGFPGKKAELLQKMAASSGGRTLVVAGDIHAAYASVEHGVPCLTTPAISSGTASEVAGEAVAGYGLDPSAPGIGVLILALDGLFKEANPALVLSDTQSHGLVVLDLDGDAATATFQLINAAEVKTSYAGKAAQLRSHVRTVPFRVEPGKITPVG
jgi:alkaline phosphatase D